MNFKQVVLTKHHSIPDKLFSSHCLVISSNIRILFTFFLFFIFLFTTSKSFSLDSSSKSFEYSNVFPFINTFPETKSFSTSIQQDYDDDGIPDSIDLDDDNDGILDTEEGTADLDNDGKINKFDEDSDGDGCSDVREAGYPDANNDDYYGDEPPLVNPEGKVIGAPYDSPADANNNGTKDYLEVGSTLSLTSSPTSLNVLVGSNVQFTGNGTVANGTITYNWQISTDNGGSWSDLSNGGQYSGVTTTTLSISSVTIAMSTYSYRLYMRTPAYVCDLDVITNVASLTVFLPDFDNDLVPDEIDLDDDNDGILDAVEGSGDLDNDTKPNDKDYDSDGDGCKDVQEAGFTDGNSDGKLGYSPVQVDAQGKVTSGVNNENYQTPDDLDGNGTYDFLEVGGEVSVTGHPVDITISDTKTATFTAAASAIGSVGYEWYESSNNGQTWESLCDKPDLMITGVMEGSWRNGNWPRMVELYAIRDIPDLRVYGLDVATSSYTSAPNQSQPLDNKSLVAGEFYIVTRFSHGTYFDKFFPGVPPNQAGAGGHKMQTMNDVGNIQGQYPVVLYKRPNVSSSTWTKVDEAGVNGENGWSKPWKYRDGWMYRKKNTGPKTAFEINDWTVCNDCMWMGGQGNWKNNDWHPQDKRYPLKEFGGAGPLYGDCTNSTLTMSNVPYSMNGYKYKALAKSISFQCDVDLYSNDANLTVFEDTDNDDVPNTDDVDDDNDGILDTEEGGGDLDNDGIPNILDLDSDGDGCFDVKEAGFTDGNNDGILGSPPYQFNSQGKVIAVVVDGYTTPDDIDNNGVKDYLEAGDAITVNTQPVSVIVASGTNTTFSVVATSSTAMVYQWQEKTSGGNWTNLANVGVYSGVTTTTLTLTNVPGGMNANKYQVVITTPSFLCGSAITSSEALLTVKTDNDEDGIENGPDLDDDNDGILDTEEGTGDLDSDGIPNHFDLDSDGDGCNDVIEAGFSDSNDDGILGGTPVNVDGDGKVTGSGGYTSPAAVDLNNNGTQDYREAGSNPTIASQPANRTRAEGDIFTFSVSGSAVGGVSIQWQESTDNGQNWNNLADGGIYSGVTTTTLTITGPSLSMDANQYRGLINSLSYLCGTTETSNAATMNVLLDTDGDLVPDNYDRDDDNDGILDSHEPGDSDNDGIPDRLELDSDNDGCYDVVEAGWSSKLGTSTDDGSDNNGKPGDGNHTCTPGNTGSCTVWVYYSGNTIRNYWRNGRIKTHQNSGFYNNGHLDDLDGNGTHDFQEAGTSASNNNVCPSDVTTTSGQSSTFTADGTPNGKVKYTWQESFDNGTSWRNLDDPLMITGVMSGGRNGNYPVVVELYALSDIPNLNIYNVGIDYNQSPNQNYYRYPYYPFPNIALAKGSYFYAYRNASYFDNYFSGFITRSNQNSKQDNHLNATYAGDDAITLIRKNTQPNPDVWEIVDVVGVIGEDGTGQPWEYNEGWLYRKNNKFPTPIFNMNDWTACNNCVDNANTHQQAIDNAGNTHFPIQTISYPKAGSYSDVNGATLTVNNLLVAQSGNKYRSLLSTEGFKCGVDAVTCAATLTVHPDNDLDGVKDDDDLDDDNDGILDTDEGNGDFDSDGIPNSFDLDSDGDGCNDVIEAGFSDSNGDGLLGPSAPPPVDGQGKVTGTPGYTTPNDLDNANGKDFLQFGSAVSILANPVKRITNANTTVTYSVTATGIGGISYQWQVWDTNSWSNITNNATYSNATTSTLTVSNVTSLMNNYRYKVIVSILSFACDIDVTSNQALLNISDDFDQDGIINSIDEDDDNDGILDIEEGGGDLDGDGVPNFFDLDSDGDGCKDVKEAGLVDTDDNGILGVGSTSAVGVNAAGRVITNENGTSVTGYTDPLDADNSGTKDYKELSAGVIVSDHPVDRTIVENTTTTFESEGTLNGGALITFQWQVSTNGGLNWFNLANNAIYSNVKTKVLTVTNPPLNYSGYLYRVAMNNASFECDIDIFSTEALLTVLADTDSDGVADLNDLDDDNDGILDTQEGFGDFDQDGIPNNLDLDSDADNCNDVLEAGFTDANNDGMLGPSAPPPVDANGKVTGSGGYTTPQDLNENGSKDYKEEGSAIVSNTCPSDVTSDQGANATFETDVVINSGSVDYQWQYKAPGEPWKDIPYTDLMITAVVRADRNNSSKPEFMELYALNDIPDLSLYAIDVANDVNGYTSNSPSETLNPVSLSKGSYYYVLTWSGNFTNWAGFNGTVVGVGQNSWEMNQLNGRKPVILYKRSSNIANDWEIVDDFGGNGVDAHNDPWAYGNAWVKRKNNTFPSTTFDWNDWERCSGGNNCLNNISSNSVAGAQAFPFKTFTTTSYPFSNPTIKTLYLNNIQYDLNGYQFKALLTTPGYVCDTDQETCAATLTVTPTDTDDDGVPDKDDVDDDNDGILDTEESEDDLDSDGIINSLDLDSDGDGCNDVIEAGFTDTNDDGMLGPDDFPTVDGTGKVTGHGGYTNPSALDGDGNGINDYKEEGAIGQITSHPIDAIREVNDDVTFSVTANATGALAYQWQKKELNGVWEDLVKGGSYFNVTTNSLLISPIAQNMSLVKFRVIVSTSSFLCDSDLISNEAVLTVKEDTDDDGVSNDSDLDDDNDGILDTDENSGGNTDLDSDGVPNSLDIDSDGDGCNDVIEAGFIDDDNNGILGTDPVIVDANGIVTNWAGKTVNSGYTPANDGDNNGTKDYKEAGGKVTSITNPTSVIISDKRDVTFTVASSALGGISTQWQESSDNGQSWSNLINQVPYSGVTTNNLLITNASLSLSGNQYRAFLTTTSYICDQDTASLGAILTVLPDNDEDNIQDIYDLDDDNDGILDTEEGVGDLDLDGIPNYLDLDSDGDNCNDVVEAGFIDPDDNGILGTGTSVGNAATDVKVDAQGRVIKNVDNSDINPPGYTTPNDLDSNNTKDYLENGSQVQITSQPINTTVLESNNTVLTVAGTSDAYISYKWQQSTTNCNTWSDIEESPALMISGVLDGNRNGGNEPRIVELYAVRDIPNLSLYGLDIALDGTNSTNPDYCLGCGWANNNPTSPVTSLQKGQYMLVSYREWLNNQHPSAFFDNTIPGSSINHKSQRFSRNNHISGNDPIVLYERETIGGTYTQIDIFGVNGQNGTGQSWEYTDGWAYRKNGRTSSTVFSLNDWKMCKGCVDNGLSSNSAAQNPYPIMTFKNPQEFFGSNTNTLTINNVPFTLNQNKYRVVLSTPSYVCGDDLPSDCATLTVSQDSDRDNDGVGDSQDLDADNDGILNSIEGTGDFDGDGQPNYLDLDSDNDGCNDVLEAGFTDNDNDGFLGLSAGNPTELIVDINGVVTSGSDGYTTPEDLDNNGEDDYKQVGSAITLTRSPVSTTVLSGSYYKFIGASTSQSSIIKQWQQSTDGGTNWTTLKESSHLMITGLFDGWNWPRLIEFYAVKDIPDLRKFGFDVATNGGSSTQPANTGIFPQISLDSGQFLVVKRHNYNQNQGRNESWFTITETQAGHGGHKHMQSNEAGQANGNDVVVLYERPDINTNSGWEKVDMLGELGVNGTNQAWDYENGWLYRNDTTQASPTFNINDWTACKNCNNGYNDNAASNQDSITVNDKKIGKGFPIKSFRDPTFISGVKSDTLSIINIPFDMDGIKFSLVMKTPEYHCDVDVFTDANILNVFRPDPDGDGVFDWDDLDDDNDGILDIHEDVGNTDLDGDGIINSLDRDADGDGCDDVIEAGFVDGDNNGILGSSPVEVNEFGIVTNWVGKTASLTKNGYTDPEAVDLNGNGVFDYREAGSAITITSQMVPVSYITGTDPVVLEVPVSVVGAITYQWKKSPDGVTWTDVSGAPFSGQTTNKLTISDPSALNNYRFKVFMTTPAYVCDTDVESTLTKLSFSGDFDEDGIVDGIDLDDDNDGITDIEEGSGNIDNDAYPNYFDLDSDGDGCPDVQEAGLIDPDDNGILGTGLTNTVVVDASGLVIKNVNNTDVTPPGYSDPKDLDNNGTDDYKEAGSSPTITSHPSSSTIIKSGAATFTVAVTTNPVTPVTYQWQVKVGAAAWTNLSELAPYSGTQTNTLNISAVTNGMDGNKYRVLVITAAYVCAADLPSNEVNLTVLPDFDDDGVDDSLDLDDDNDGILDTEEGDDDLDNDGEPNRRDLDSDGDGCPDVQEAGLIDPDDNGILGTGLTNTVKVDADGKVIKNADNTDVNPPGYTTPAALDGDNNGTQDYKEVGTGVTFSTQPANTSVLQGSNATFQTTISASGSLVYQWQKSDDGIAWENIDESASLMISGLFKGDIGDTYPRAIELYAFEDIPDLSVYGIEIASNGNQPTGQMFNLNNVSVSAGSYYLVSEPGTYFKTWFGTDPNQQEFVNIFDGNDAVLLYKNNVVVDVAGVPGENGTGKNWDHNNGWMYRKNGTISKTTFSIDDWKTCKDCSDTYGNNSSMNSPFTIKTFANPSVYRGVKTPTLNILNVSPLFDEMKYRLIVTTPSYVCEVLAQSSPAELILQLDNDEDGVIDSEDLDDDNDGILDTEEGDDDLDGDGIKNSFDLDSDGDGCYDVKEAGFSDLDDNGILTIGTSSEVIVDAQGLVIKDKNNVIIPANEKYTTPGGLDGDSNGIQDYKEVGTTATLTSSPSSATVTQNKPVTFTVSATTQNIVHYQWQEKIPGGVWTDLTSAGNYSGTNTNTLSITNGFLSMNENLYRCVIKNAAYICGIDVISQEALLTIQPDNDEDGITDDIDEDDDNDGIKDIQEDAGGNLDIDNDGIKNSFDLDSDGDGCLDVKEAGFTDPDDNGILGTGSTSEVGVNAQGLVTHNSDNSPVTDGYTPTRDGDSNGVKDYKEEGFAIQITTQPIGKSITLGADIILTVQDANPQTTTYQWQEGNINNNPISWSDIPNFAPYSGATTNQLTITNPQLALNGYKYRVVLTNASFLCAVPVTSDEVVIGVTVDFDEDGIDDSIDLDDDNDGILDTEEGDDDLDNDGLPNRFDLDSDGDGCLDVQEAGLTDPDDNGILGTGLTNTVVVNVEGKVIKNEDNTDVNPPGYTTPAALDRDNNGIDDYKETGIVEFTTQPLNTTVTKNFNATFTFVTSFQGTITYQWQEKVSSGNWTDLVESNPPNNITPYTGVTTQTLTVSNVTNTMNGNKYRVMANVIANICIPHQPSGEAILTVLTDFDDDGIDDSVDLDDDNDGILDTEEGDNVDTDNDGENNHHDLDSDGDGCPDVQEAGLTDPDDNGILGTGLTNTVIVDAEGKVIKNEDNTDVSPPGYTTPNDLDGNGVKDYLEAGSLPTITSQPVNRTIIKSGFTTFTFTESTNPVTPTTYQWQEKVGAGNWTDLVESNPPNNVTPYTGVTTQTLTVSNVTNAMNGTKYRVLIITVSYVCADDLPSNEVTLTVLPDFDDDGIDDTIDLDDDNDGILDTEEGDDDLDGDGEPNRRDLDSDGDGCLDVKEANLYDPDDNGIVTIGSTTEVIVDAQGLVIADLNSTPISAIQGYTTPAAVDGDNNGIDDYKEVGSAIIVNTQPVSMSTVPNSPLQFTISITASGTVDYQWQQQLQNSSVWTNLTNVFPYSGVNTNTLTISDPSTMHRYKFRVIMSTPAYLCDLDITSSEAELIISVDNDDDGILDGDDLDDDNDGILDTEEGNGNMDGDGLPNYFDLDSDGDGCPDVREAGFSDPNNDSILADLPTIVDAQGLVIGTNKVDGYTTPNDINGNGTHDYLEVGSSITFTSHPSDISVITNNAAYFTYVISAQGILTYQWQISTDSSTWVNLINNSPYSGVTTDTLKISSVSQGMYGYQYRVIATNVAYVCDPSSISNPGMLTLLDDYDDDGIPDIDDIDDDNDGILDTEEGFGDIDKDGKPNHQDLDSDGDSCFDVTEAGFTDDDSDGILGKSPVVEDSVGRVISDAHNAPVVDGYTTPNDSDSNGISDYKEVGSSIVFQPSTSNSVLKVTGSDTTLTFFGGYPTRTLPYEIRGIGDAPEVFLDTAKVSIDLSKGAQFEKCVLRLDINSFNDGLQVYINGDTILYFNQSHWDPFNVLGGGVSLNRKYEFGPNGIFDIDGSGLWEPWKGEGNPKGIIKNGEIKIFATTINGTREDILDYMDVNHPMWVRKTNIDFDCVSGFEIVYGNTKWFSVNVVNYVSIGATRPAQVKAQGNIVGQSFMTKNTGGPLLWIVTNAFGGVGISQTQLEDGIAESKIIIREYVNEVETGVNHAVTGSILAISTPSPQIVNYDYGPQYPSVNFDFEQGSTLMLDPNKKYVMEFIPGPNIRIHYDDFDFYNEGRTYDIDGTNFNVDRDIPFNLVYGDLGNIHNIVNIESKIDAYGVIEAYILDPIDSVSTSSGKDSTLITIDVNAAGKIDYQWQESRDTAKTWIDLVESSMYEGVKTDSLVINDPQASMNGYQYRSLVSTPGFSCGNDFVSAPMMIEIEPDNDDDGISDEIDLDDDNDGILDTEEGDDDLDGDGIKNSFDLDSDGDGCPDVLEAGFSDPNNDSILADVPTVVDAQGLVIGTNKTDGYTIPNDLDVNGIKDYLQEGSPISIDLQPVSINMMEGSDTLFIASASAIGPITYQWQESRDSTTWNNLIEGSPYIGVTNDTLVIENVDYSMNGYRYRVLFFNSSFICDPMRESDVANLNLQKDTDEDDVQDEIDDLDDDNDGILDTVEDTVDTDRDGIPNHLDLDSDGDGCFDVIEAGFTDPDNDGILGTSPVLVDGDGKVIKNADSSDVVDGYTEPADLNNNGIKDYLEEGVLIDIILSPVSFTSLPEQDTLILTAQTNIGDFVYQWQESKDEGKTWNDLFDITVNKVTYSGTNTIELTILPLKLTMDTYRYRLVVSNPSFVCQEDVISEEALIEVFPRIIHIPTGFSPDGDGVNDKWVIRGLEPFPNNKVTLYNRWEIKIYEKEKYFNHWDGRRNVAGVDENGNSKKSKNLLPEGVYFYVLDLGDESRKPLKGYVYLRRRD